MVRQNGTTIRITAKFESILMTDQKPSCAVSVATVYNTKYTSFASAHSENVRFVLNMVQLTEDIVFY